ncbi:MAG TPA: spore germination protein, partial [Firmicutes bacterium]|nr:spore germination protein [Bacillota bacterium]
WVGGFLLLVHLASLESFGIPYLYPFCGGEKNGGEDWKDSLWRVPLHWMKQRPIFARQKARRRIGGK